MLAKELYMSEAGYVLGYSPHFPGPSSPMGIQKSGVFLKVAQVPRLTDTNSVDYWTIELGNYLAHEIGHYLGLSHTYEFAMKTLVDNFADTSKFNTGNMMDPEIVRSERVRLTAEQARELNSHPIVRSDP